MDFKFSDKPPRRYPILRDKTGRSARARAFELFAAGKSAPDTSKMLGIKLSSARRYLGQYRMNPSDETYKTVKSALKNGTITLDGIALAASRVFPVPLELIRAELSKPWGIKRLCEGKLGDRAAASRDDEFAAVLDLAITAVRYARKHRASLDDIREAFKEAMAVILQEERGENEEGEEGEEYDDTSLEEGEEDEAEQPGRNYEAPRARYGYMPVYPGWRNPPPSWRPPYPRRAYSWQADYWALCRQNWMTLSQWYQKSLSDIVAEGHKELEARDIFFQRAEKKLGPAKAARFRAGIDYWAHLYPQDETAASPWPASTENAGPAASESSPPHPDSDSSKYLEKFRVVYWEAIKGIMAQGYDEVAARELLYDNFLKNNGQAFAAKLRELQDMVHQLPGKNTPDAPPSKPGGPDAAPGASDNSAVKS